MYQLTKADGEILLVFLAYNPIFTMYKRLSERTEWAEYMKVRANQLETLKARPLRLC